MKPRPTLSPKKKATHYNLHATSICSCYEQNATKFKIGSWRVLVGCITVLEKLQDVVV